MTARDLLYLSWLSYIDLPEYYISMLSRGGRVPVAAFADAILRMDAVGALNRELNDAARGAARETRENECVITEYVDDNARTGFAAYVFICGERTVIAMRGSDSQIDWIDNVCAPFADSAQAGYIRALAEKYDAGEVIYTGHSKGGHNALLALAYSQNPNARAVAFSAQGFGDGELTDEQRQKLAARGVNYVVSGDVIGSLLEHPERRIFTRGAMGVNAHMPEAFIFDMSGEPARARRGAASRITEFGTRLAQRKLKYITGGKIAEICRRSLARALR